ncbi:MAG: DUF3035 domain-containing protein [Sphingomonadales bacterium]|nr:DUF3035 domain-containing protein [Sphingomonadales bacterium]
MRKTTANKKVTGIALASVTTLLLAGCGHGGLLSRTRPDEFAVQRQAPLLVPPDFALVPPQPGTPRPSAAAGQQETLDALFGGPAPRSEVERRTISRAGAPDAGIRSTVADPQTHSVAKGPVTRDILAAPEGDGREAQASTAG